MSAPSKERLFSLDILRGADIFLLSVVCSIVNAIDRFQLNDKKEGCFLPTWFMDQFEHPEWVGFSAHDMIMPLFIFMCGAALPLALPRRLNPDGTAGWPYWKHVLQRVGMLWVFGMISQGELFTFDLHRISFFNNTLQTIACGYLIAAGVHLIRRKWLQIAIPFALSAFYLAFIHLCGDLTPSGNAAVVYEVKFLSLFYPGPDAANLWHPVRQIHRWHYTWWTTIPMFGVMGLAGYHATKILLENAWSKAKRCGVQALVGVGLVGLGFALMTFDPCIKHIFTVSFTALAMGISFLLYAGCYYCFDILAWRKGTWLVNLYGRHSLFSYMMGDTVLASVIWVLARIILFNKVNDFDHGIGRFLSPAWAGLAFAVMRGVVLTWLLWMWDNYKRYQRLAAKAV